MILQIKTEKELIQMVEALQKEVGQLSSQNKKTLNLIKSMQADIDKKPNVEIRETVLKEIEKPVNTETTLIQTDKTVLPQLKKLSDRLKALEDVKPLKPVNTETTLIQTDKTVLPQLKKLSDRLKALEDVKPLKQKPCTVKKDVELIKKSIDSIAPSLNKKDIAKIIDEHIEKEFLKFSSRIPKGLTSKQVSEMVAEQLKTEIQKSIKQLPKSMDQHDVLEIIDKHVTIEFVNRLYKRGGK